MRRHVPGGGVGDSAAVAAEGAPRHHHAGPRQPECLEAPQNHPAENQTEAVPEKHRSTAASRRNPSRRKGRRGEQRRREVKQMAWRGRSGVGGSVEAGGDGGRHRGQWSAARATPGASGARERGESGGGRRSGLTDRTNRSGQTKLSRPGWAG
jgi:hypothetical protein